MARPLGQRNIIAIGGGDIREGETESFDRELVRLAKASQTVPGRVRLLCIPTASQDSEDYVCAVTEAYGKLGCEVEPLRLWGVDGDPIRAKRKVEEADAVYVGGGNTKALIEVWRHFGVDLLLYDHLQAGKPVAGLSAGALCWFRVANSDWPQFEAIPNVNTARLVCLGFVDLVACPHTAREEFRLGEFREMMRGEVGIGIGLDDCSAFQIRDDEYRILSTHPDAVVHRIEWVGGALDERVLTAHDDYRPLDLL